jgi:diguanylate cyclase (GGDEF)-like protein
VKSTKQINPFAPLEARKFILPISIASIIILAGMSFSAIYSPIQTSSHIISFGLVGIFYVIIANLIMVRFNINKNSYGITTSLLTGFGMGYLCSLLPMSLSNIFHFLVIFSTTATATVFGRRYAYLSLLCIVAITLPTRIQDLRNMESILGYMMPIIVSIVVFEVIIRLKNTANQHIHRLETINKVSRQLMLSLDTKQTLALLDATIQGTLEADTFFIGILEEDKLNLELFYDDGEYFNQTRVPTTGTLSSWVINNQKELFLPDLRENVQLDGIDIFVVGKEKTSLSWIGVPLKAENITGILGLASYTVNAFDRADLELLINLGQHVTLALDNTIRHAQVEKQARLDSLTGVYNHGYFLKNLAEQASASNKPLSLIMLDIDYFKQYNDSYGHLVGDRVLQSLCTAIQKNIKQSDSVGRWGGEEFVISLPGADLIQAAQIAKRISETLGSLRVEDREQNSIPIPTISQGIAVYPNEADEIYRLIDIADKRLYTAKERGRNQIEPDPDPGDG